LAAHPLNYCCLRRNSGDRISAVEGKPNHRKSPLHARLSMSLLYSAPPELHAFTLLHLHVQRSSKPLELHASTTARLQRASRALHIDRPVAHLRRSPSLLYYLRVCGALQIITSPSLLMPLCLRVATPTSRLPEIYTSIPPRLLACIATPALPTSIPPRRYTCSLPRALKLHTSIPPRRYTCSVPPELLRQTSSPNNRAPCFHVCMPLARVQRSISPRR